MRDSAQPLPVFCRVLREHEQARDCGALEIGGAIRLLASALHEAAGVSAGDEESAAGKGDLTPFPELEPSPRYEVVNLDDLASTHR
jgi:hypothetical protein